MCCMTTAEPIPFLSLPWRMKMALDAAGIGVSEMAERMGVDRNTVSNWINGRVKPRAAFLRVWADECEVDYRWLSEGMVVVNAQGLSELLSSLDTDEEPVFEVCLGDMGRDGKGQASIQMLPLRRRPDLGKGVTEEYPGFERVLAA